MRVVPKIGSEGLLLFVESLGMEQYMVVTLCSMRGVFSIKNLFLLYDPKHYLSPTFTYFHRISCPSSLPSCNSTPSLYYIILNFCLTLFNLYVSIRDVCLVSDFIISPHLSFNSPLFYHKFLRLGSSIVLVLSLFVLVFFYLFYRSSN